MVRAENKVRLSGIRSPFPCSVLAPAGLLKRQMGKSTLVQKRQWGEKPFTSIENITLFEKAKLAEKPFSLTLLTCEM